MLRLWSLSPSTRVRHFSPTVAELATPTTNAEFDSYGSHCLGEKAPVLIGLFDWVVIAPHRTPSTLLGTLLPRGGDRLVLAPSGRITTITL